MSENDSKIH